MKEFSPTECTILMVDDTPKNLQVLGNTLKNENYNLEFATSGKSALEWLKKKNFDLILLDVMMPQMSGFDVCKIIREDEKLNDMAIIFLTAKTDKESIVSGFELGAQDYVTKPFDTKELLARVKTQLELKYSKEKLKDVNKWLENEVALRTKELEQVNLKLDKANTELLNIDKTKSEFLRMISHEIRTPLNGILGPLHLLKDKINSDELMKLVTILDKSVERLENYSMMALRITELNSNKAKFDFQEFILKEIIEFCIINLSNAIKERNIEVENNINETVTIKADYDRLLECLKILFHNIILNFSKMGKIMLSADTKENNVVLKLSAIDIKGNIKQMSHLFGLNVSDDSIVQHPGMDIYLARLILEKHNSTIDILKIENGLEFLFSFN